ncbi:mitochondrial distribution and morphology [Yamadazyma tenuis]|nr:mitochondrial distribution and morphology [Yamadazyma tenuis]
MQDHQIIDAIDSKQFLRASSLIKVKSAKFPNQSYYVALANYLLYRQGNVKQALDECAKLLTKTPNDPRTTDLLYIIFMESDKIKESNEVYENVIKKFPNNCQEHVTQWFQNSVKYGNIKALQKSCFHLSKIHGEPKYKMWAAFSSYLLANELRNDEKQYNLFCTLGFRIIEGITPSSTQELFVFVKVLDNNKPKIIEYIESYPGVLDLDVKIEYLSVLHSLKQNQKLFDFTARLLFDQEFNDFDTWKLYIESGFELGKPFEQLEDSIKAYKWSRNSQLALLELSKVYHNLEKFNHYNLAYYDKFNTKTCCFSDLASYNVNNESLVNGIKEVNNNLEDQEITTSNLNLFVNNQKLLHHFGMVSESFYDFNWRIYKQFLPLLKEKLDTDFYLANELIVMNVIHSLDTDQSFENVLKNVIVLNYLVSNDPLDYKVNLWLIKLFRLVGLIPEALRIYELLKVRMMQHDSLGHLILEDVSTLYPNKSMLNYSVNIYRFYLTCQEDLNENSLKAFDNGAYNKLENFLSFSKRFKFSFQYFECVLETFKMTKILGDKNYENHFFNKFFEIEETIQTAELTDNRDNKIFWKSLGFKSEFVDQFESKFTAVKQDKQALLKLKYFKESLILQPSEIRFKAFNKLLPNVQLTKFDSWLMKVYLNLFKLNNTLNKSEFESTMNFLIKNLKITKIPITTEFLSRELNHQMSSLFQLVRYTSNSKNKQVVNLGAALSRQIDTSYKQKQMDALSSWKIQLGDFELDITKEFVDDQVDKLHDAFIKASYVHLR